MKSIKITIAIQNPDYRIALAQVLESLGHTVVAIAITQSIRTIALAIVQSEPVLLFIDEELGPGYVLGDILYECEIALPSNHIKWWRMHDNPRIFRTTERRNSLSQWSRYSSPNLHFLLQLSSKEVMSKVLARRIKLALEDLKV